MSPRRQLGVILITAVSKFHRFENLEHLNLYLDVSGGAKHQLIGPQAAFAGCFQFILT